MQITLLNLINLPIIRFEMESLFLTKLLER